MRPRPHLALLPLLTAAGVVGPASAAAARTFDVPLDPRGPEATEVASSRGTLAWFTAPPPTDAPADIPGGVGGEPTAVHVRAPGGTVTSAPVAGRGLSGLSVGSDASGDLVLLAVRDLGDARRPAGDVVRIDPRSGRLTPVPVASRARVDETAAAVDRGLLVIGRRTDGRAAIYRSALDGVRVRRLVGTRDLPQGFASDEVTDLAVRRTGPDADRASLAITTAGTREEFGTQRAYAGRPRTPRLVHRAGSGGANVAAIRGLSWESDTRLWFTRTNQGSGTGNRIYRHSTLTRRRAAATGSANVLDTAWTSRGLGVVGAFAGGSGGAGTLAATGPLRPTRVP